MAAHAKQRAAYGLLALAVNVASQGAETVSLLAADAGSRASINRRACLARLSPPFPWNRRSPSAHQERYEAPSRPRRPRLPGGGFNK